LIEIGHQEKGPLAGPFFYDARFLVFPGYQLVQEPTQGINVAGLVQTRHPTRLHLLEFIGTDVSGRYQTWKRVIKRSLDSLDNLTPALPGTMAGSTKIK